jgi:1,2-diacylglycerol 3-beta-glucosyltransferase
MIDMPTNNAVIVPGIDLFGLRFASGYETIFVLLMGIPLVFFVWCVAYLIRLLFSAAILRHQITTLTPPTAGASDTSDRPIDITLTAQPVAGAPTSKHRFAVLIPAHNEELLLGTVLDSLSDLHYARSHYQLIVIADNCTDHTAAIAREHGALTLERFNDELIGKGYALEWALDRLRHTDSAAMEPSELTVPRPFDAVVILDADTVVSRNLLRAFDVALAAGNQAAQVRYEVLNIDDSWRTKLMSCALALAHVVKPLGRERLKLSDGLKGNGMCFSRNIVEQVPWSGKSITEDIEYTLRLCRAGYRIAFLPDAAVWAQMPTNGAEAGSQRKRWEGGRYRLLFTVGPRLLSEAWRSHNSLLRDRAYELMIPPFAELFALPMLFLTLCLLATGLLGWHWALALVILWTAVLVGEAIYLFAGMWVARMPAAVSLSLLYAPIYIGWKFGIYLWMAVNRSAGGWKRTERHEL